MNIPSRWSAAALLCAAAATAQAQVPQAQVTPVQVWAAACASCHGTDGRAAAGMAPLAGQRQDELTQKLLAFKTGQRPATLMHQIAKGYTDEQLQQLAAHFAAQRP